MVKLPNVSDSRCVLNTNITTMKAEMRHLCVIKNGQIRQNPAIISL